MLLMARTYVIETSDWIVDLGPEGGAGGGQVAGGGAPR